MSNNYGIPAPGIDYTSMQNWNQPNQYQASMQPQYQPQAQYQSFQQPQYAAQQPNASQYQPNQGNFGIQSNQGNFGNSPNNPQYSQKVWTGWDKFGAGVNALGSLAQAYTGYKGIQAAEKDYSLRKEYMAKNYKMQANLTDSALRDRQQRRINAWERSGHNTRGARPQEVNSYMDKYGSGIDRV